MNDQSQPAIDPHAPPTGPGCVECDRESSWWVHLRRCANCGHIGCCDDSLNQHATKHAAETGHPVIQSFEPGEDWFWDYRTNDYTDGPRLVSPESHPHTQPVPGPADRLPRNWRALLEEREGLI